MVPFGNGEIGLRRPAARAGAAGRGHVRQIAPAIVVLAVLMLIGRGVAVTLGSPLLAIVAVGMTFLIGVAVFGAVDSNRH
ncbi:hypothetical protein [Sphingomonas oryzagri]|uniref:Uncharacterized protein n=1 Tax=Sphingomonas oryzagri TaxID=3042314 RepID=A0ABT6N2K2_9SPHN|nr:hypothetical protein [Sphingomonas oryzagri]MDH7639520.1 hypothetical protein [Sphingomonas oryzagri]